MTSDNLALLGLMRLVSPALPVGGFAYSQGLEAAVDQGWVTDAQATQSWLSGVISNGLAVLDVPLLARLYDSADELESYIYWNQYVLACRETMELRKEELQMGRALWRLLSDLDYTLPGGVRPTWVGAFALAGKFWGLDRHRTCLGFLWSWLENQLAVAAKTIPIGQTDVQRIAQALQVVLVDAVDTALRLEESEIGGGMPGLVMASMKHETQYSRLFRS